MEDQITWALVDATAEKLGTTKFTRDKWRSRGIPPAAQIKIFEELRARGFAVAFSDFDRIAPSERAAA